MFLLLPGLHENLRTIFEYASRFIRTTERQYSYSIVVLYGYKLTTKHTWKELLLLSATAIVWTTL